MKAKRYVNIEDNQTQFDDHIYLGDKVIVVDGSYMTAAEGYKRNPLGIDFVKENTREGKSFELLTVTRINIPFKTVPSTYVLRHQNNCEITGADDSRYYCSLVNIRKYESAEEVRKNRS